MTHNPYSLSDQVPRSVPLLLQMRLLLGGVFATIFWAFFGFGMIFVWMFSLDSTVAEAVRFHGLETAPGVVTGFRKTNLSVNDSPVYATEYRFSIGNVARFSESYDTGRYLEAGAAVTVEFPKGNPAHSRIRGMRAAPAGPMALLALIFPLIMAPAWIWTFLRGRRAIRILRWGALGKGTLKEKTATNVQVNHQVVFKLAYSFRASDGMDYTAVARTHETEKLEDEKEEPLLYLPENPSYAVMLDALPGNPRIDEMGGIRARLGVAGALALFLPVAVIVVHGTIAICRFAG